MVSTVTAESQKDVWWIVSYNKVISYYDVTQTYTAM